MCCYKTLGRNEHGYVTRCNNCRHIHVAFGNTLLAFTYDQFTSFRQAVVSQYETNKYCYPKESKSIQIPTAIRSIILVYSLNELEQFIPLLNEAIKEIGNEQLFVFSKN